MNPAGINFYNISLESSLYHGTFGSVQHRKLAVQEVGHEKGISGYIDYIASTRSNYIKTWGKRGKSGALETNKQIFQRFKICNTFFHRIQNFHFADYNRTMHMTNSIHVYIFEILRKKHDFLLWCLKCNTEVAALRVISSVYVGKYLSIRYLGLQG